MKRQRTFIFCLDGDRALKDRAEPQRRSVYQPCQPMLRSQVSDAGGDTAKSYQQKAVACPLGIVRKKHLEDNQAKKKRERRSSLNVRWTFIGDNNGQNFFLSIFQSGVL